MKWAPADGALFSGVLSAMSAMVNIEIPWINILSKMDLVTAPQKSTGQGDLDDDEEKRDGPGPLNGKRGRRNIAKYLFVPPFYSTIDLNLTNRVDSLIRIL